MEFDAVIPAKLFFYKRYVDDIYARRKIHQRHASYHQNITVEVNPSKFLDSELIREKGSILTQIFNKTKKSNFDKEIREIREKYRNAGFRSNLVNETIRNFKKKQKKLLYLNGFLKKEKYLL